MLTMFQPCIESDVVSGSASPLIQKNEFFGTVWTGDPPDIGQAVSFGGAERWEIVKLERFSNEADAVMVAYFKLIEHPTLPEDQWDCWRLDREYGFEGYHLAIYLNSDDQPMNTSVYYHNEHPQIGEVLPSYERTNHPTLMQSCAPYHQIESIEIYRPEQSFYKALYLCRCKLVESLVAA